MMESVESGVVLGHLNRLTSRFPMLEPLCETVLSVYQILEQCFSSGGKLLVCGNGGSAADADHIAGELMKGFYLKRPLPAEERERFGNEGNHLQRALPAIALTQHTALSTAFSNDVDPYLVFAQQGHGYGRGGDVLLAISTSGNSRNVCEAVRVTRAKKMKTIGLTGAAGGLLLELCEVCVTVPEMATPDVQELHLPVYHTLCAMLESRFFAE